MRRRTKQTLHGCISLGIIATVFVAVFVFLLGAFCHLCWAVYQFGEKTWGWQWPF